MSNLAVQGPSDLAANPFSFKKYTITRPFFTLFGRNFRVFDPSGNVIMHVQLALFSLREGWTISSGRDHAQPLVRVKNREAIALAPTTDVTDGSTGAVVGTFRSRGLRTLFKDAWDILSPTGEVVGELVEDSNALLRRFIGGFWMPGRWHLKINGAVVMEIREQRTFFAKKFDVAILSDTVDPRFAMGCALHALIREISRER